MLSSPTESTYATHKSGSVLSAASSAPSNPSRNSLTRRRHHHPAIQPDFNFVGNGLPDNFGREAVFYCQLLDSREVTLVARDDDPARVLSEQDELGSQSARNQIHADSKAFSESQIRPKLPRSRPLYSHGSSLPAQPEQVQSRPSAKQPLGLSSSAGGNPQTAPKISFAYSDEPNSVSASVASPGSEARNRTIVRPASL